MRRTIGFGLAVFVLVAAGAYIVTLQITGQASPPPEVVIASTIAPLNSVSDIPVPPLPFDDNPDPTACGVPMIWSGNGQAWLSGYYEGELVQPIVYLYDSHLRDRVTGMAATGTEVKIMLYQQNPTLNYYMVQIPNGEGGKVEGWVPAPFVSLEPVEVETTQSGA